MYVLQVRNSKFKNVNETTKYLALKNKIKSTIILLSQELISVMGEADGNHVTW